MARRRVVLGAALGVAIVGIGAAYVLASHSSSPPLCSGADAKLAGVWDATLRTVAVEAAIVKSACAG